MRGRWRTDDLEVVITLVTEYANPFDVVDMLQEEGWSRVEAMMVVADAMKVKEQRETV